MWCTSTSNIDFSTLSGSIPWLIVRLPCGSRSTQSTRWPDSAKATARLSVVVVFATPPFWLAKLITFAVATSSAPSAPSPGVAWTRRGRDRLAGGDPQLFVVGRLRDAGGRRGRPQPLGDLRRRAAARRLAPRPRPRAPARPPAPAPAPAQRGSGSERGRLGLGRRRLRRRLGATAGGSGAGASTTGSGASTTGSGTTGSGLGLGRRVRPALASWPSFIFGARSAAEKSHRSRLFARRRGFPSPAAHRARAGFLESWSRCPACSTNVWSSSPARGASASRPSSLALALAAAREGKRTILCEVAAQEHLSHVFHRSQVGFHEVEMRENLWAISIDPDESMREYVLLQLKVKPMRDLLFRSRIFTYLAAATPGLKELVTIGKIWELALDDRKARGAHRYDQVIVDAPATGHGVGFLQTPAHVRQHRQGRPDPPAGRDARRLHPRRRADRHRRRRAARGDAGERDGDARARPGRPRSGSRSTGSSATGSTRSASTSPRPSASWRRCRRRPAAPRAACRAALTESRRARSQREQLARLEENCEAPVTTLPYLFSSPSSGSRQIETLADGVVGLMAERRRAARGQARLRLRRLRRGRQDDHRGGDRRGHGGARHEGRGADDRPGQAPRRLARAARARQHRAPGRPGAVRGRRRRDRAAASCGR